MRHEWGSLKTRWALSFCWGALNCYALSSDFGFSVSFGVLGFALLFTLGESRGPRRETDGAGSPPVSRHDQGARSAPARVALSHRFTTSPSTFNIVILFNFLILVRAISKNNFNYQFFSPILLRKTS